MNLEEFKKANLIITELEQIENNLKILKTAPGLLIINMKDGWTEKEINGLNISIETDRKVREVIISDLESKLELLEAEFCPECHDGMTHGNFCSNCGRDLR